MTSTGSTGTATASAIVDNAFKDILDKIPERDQTALVQKHNVTNLSQLVDKKLVLQQRQLDGVCSDVQMVLEVVCTYVESLDSSDDNTFTWEGLENYCDYNDNSGDYVFEALNEERKKRNDTDEGDRDPDGYNLTSEERKQMEQNIEDDPLTMKIRGFSSRALQFEFDEASKLKTVQDASEKLTVAFNGKVFYVRKCYYFQQDNGETVIVGIRKFTKNEKKAICALVVLFKDTIMGPGLVEEPPIDVLATYEESTAGLPKYVQVREDPGSEPIVPLSALTPCPEPSNMPQLLFERQRLGQPPHNFGYVYENDGKNRNEERVEDINFIDLFAGSGGYHQGVMQVPGFKGVAAVEWWETACETFKKNNPETEIYCQKVEDFIEESGPTPTEFRKKHGYVPVVLCSPPCQSFSGSNRDVDHNGEKDLYRKGLSLKFFDAMETSGALIGVFENVEGMWRRPNIYFLKKIVLDHIRAGYQVRVRLHRAHVFGDPQERPRLLIYVARKFVEMPNVIETHGPNKHPYMTVGNAFKALDKVLEKVKNNPNLPPLPNMGGSSMSKPDKDEDILNLNKPARTIRCGGRAWHPTKDRAITIREAATLQSYPYRYEFVGSLTDQYKQVGNAVPGKMAKAVAKAIAESLRFVYDEENVNGEAEVADVSSEEASNSIEQAAKDKNGDKNDVDIKSDEKGDNQGAIEEGHNTEEMDLDEEKKKEEAPAAESVQEVDHDLNKEDIVNIINNSSSSEKEDIQVANEEGSNTEDMDIDEEKKEEEDGIINDETLDEEESDNGSDNEDQANTSIEHVVIKEEVPDEGEMDQGANCSDDEIAVKEEA